MATKKTNNVATEIVKKKPRGVPVQQSLAPNTEPGDNAKYLSVSMKLMQLPDIDMKDPEQVSMRLTEYFKIQEEADLKPTVAGLGLALNGMDRRRLWEIRTDVPDRNQDLPTMTRDLIKKAYKLMENLWENYMQNGKINPVSGIFLGKNNFGYQDKTEYVVTPNVGGDTDYDADDIKKRYLSDGSTLKLPTDTDE